MNVNIVCAEPKDNRDWVATQMGPGAYVLRVNGDGTMTTIATANTMADAQAFIDAASAEDDDLVYARCLTCGYESSDPSTLEMWNGYGDHIGTWTPACTAHSLWVRRDGSVHIVRGEQHTEVGPARLPSSEFNMDDLAALIRERGVHAEVGMSGGGVATLYTGQPDAEGYRCIAAGPGTYQHRDWGFSVGYWDEFGYGPDGDEYDFTYVTHMPLTDLADAIVAKHNDTKGA